MELGPLLSLRTEIKTVKNRNILLIRISGQIESENIYPLNEEIKKLFEEGIFHCILDLSEVKYINSSGIAMVLSIKKTVEKNYGKLILIQPSRSVSEIFRLTDLVASFEFADSELEAEKKF